MSALHILVVDDDPASVALLRAMAEGIGAVVAAAERPTLALDHLAAHPLDLLITDLRMPEMSGLELVRRVRGRWPEVGSLLVTGFATDAIAAEAFAAGVLDILVKPLGLGEVQARIRNAAESQRLRREVLRLRAALAAREPAARLPEAARAAELAALPALPGVARPVELSQDAVARLERLEALRDRGVITAAEFEQKKRTLLLRL